MKEKGFIGFLIFFITLFFAFPVFSGNQAQQVVNFSIGTILEISVSGNPQPLIINSLDPSYPNSEYDLLPAEDQTTYYNVTATVPFQITGHLASNMVQGAWLSIKLSEPPEGYSLGYVQLNDNYGEKLPPQTLLTSDPTSTQQLTIYYKLAADLNAGTASGINTLTLTLLEL